MSDDIDLATAGRLDKYLTQLATEHLRDHRKRASFALYATGLLGQTDRKSVEPIAGRCCGEPEKTKRMQDKLLHFLARSVWSDRAVRYEAARYAIKSLEESEDVSTWIIDDTGFLKQGKHSVGVQRQYTGSAGKVTNCQVGVSLCLATESAHVPVDFSLYIPKSWIEDSDLRKKTRIPESHEFQTKPQLAIEMLRAAKREGLPGKMVLADAGYGDGTDFRNSLRELGLDYAVGVSGALSVVKLDSLGRKCGEPVSIKDLAHALSSKRYRRITWRAGTREKMCSRFAFIRVKTTHDDGKPLIEHEEQWLVAEWPDAEDGPTKYTLTTLPSQMSKKEIVRCFRERFRTERMYQELKGELGLDHFEGRSFPGWHHHVSVVIACAAFIVAEQARSFSPGGEESADPSTHKIAA
jgi:SRSO17 transposase